MCRIKDYFNMNNKMNNKMNKKLLQACPKNKKNAACSGVAEGMCEVNFDKYCIWYVKLIKENTSEIKFTEKTKQ